MISFWIEICAIAPDPQRNDQSIIVDWRNIRVKAIKIDQLAAWPQAPVRGDRKLIIRSCMRRGIV
jgi:hypothetical protein